MSLYIEILKKIFSKKRYVFLAIVIVILLVYIQQTVPFGSYDYLPDKNAGKEYKVPLDPASPWPKFRGNSLQNGRSSVKGTVSKGSPWMFKTGKGIFSSPVIDKEGNVYIGSADHFFYAIDKSGALKWKVRTGEIIDSSALLDDKGKIYFGSGDGFVYCLNRMNGKVLWRTPAHTVEEVEKEFDIKTYNVNWFEGNMAMLPDGTILAPNDNYLLYEIDRDSGKRLTQYPANEMIWSLPAVNTKTGKIFFGTCFMAVKNIFSYDYKSKELEWTAGGLGTNAASVLLTSEKENGAVITGAFDGYVRAYAQDTGKELWKFGARDHIYSSAAQLSDGTIVVPSADGTIYGIDPEEGTQKWAYDTLEPIRSSPAVDGGDRIYVGSGEGRLFCINPDGTLRWAYLCIDEVRNDLNASPGLGHDGVYIAGENGGVFFVPYDYPLTKKGKKDPRCISGPGEVLPDKGVFLVYTEPFGRLLKDEPKIIDGNDSLTYTLMVRQKRDTVKSAIDPESIKVTVTGAPKMKVMTAANRNFLTIVPQETWTGPKGGKISVSIEGTYSVDLSRIGLKFFGGDTGGSFKKTKTYIVRKRTKSKNPYKAPANSKDRSSVFEISRYAAPNPTMLPSYNQIGFDSLHYLGGAVEREGDTLLLWVIGGKLDSETKGTVVDPSLKERFPLTLKYDDGLVTLFNYDGFKINFIGSWDMPFGFYRLSARAEKTGKILDKAALNAVAHCDEIEFYGKGLKLMGMSEFDTGYMTAVGGADMKLWKNGTVGPPSGTGNAEFKVNKESAVVKITGGSLKKDEHVFSLLLVNMESGRAAPLYYTKKTTVSTDEKGNVASVKVTYNEGDVTGKVRAYYMVDTYPAAKKEVAVK